MLEDFHIRSGSGGRGRWNAGDGIIRTIRFLARMDCTILSGHRRIRPFGLGTEKVEDCVSRQFPDARFLRMDRDTMSKKGAHAEALRTFRKGEADIPALVRAIYIGLDPRLAGAAGLSTLAHLEDLVARGLVATDGAPSILGRYRLAATPR